VKSKKKSNSSKRTQKKSQALYYVTVVAVLCACVAIIVFVHLRRERLASIQKPEIEPADEEVSVEVEEDTSGEGHPPVSEVTGEEESGQGEEQGEKPEKKVAEEPKGRIALVIDDCGYNTHQLVPFLDFPGPITFAILPGLPYTEKATEMVVKAGRDVILHQPMEAVGEENPGPGAIYLSMSDLEITTTISHNLDEIPQARGMNNHMGSLITADERVMFAVMGVLKERGLFFLDSLTTPDSKAEEIAKKVGTLYVNRSVFLDNLKDRQSIVDSVQRGLSTATKQGHAVMIGHVWTDTLADILIEMYPEIIGDGYEFVSLSDLIEEWK